ncbi:MAG: hypothetical protein AAF518_25715 [Spirochaetota bacterium]
MNSEKYKAYSHLFNVTQSIQAYPAKVLWQQRYFAEYKSIFTAFYSFCQVEGKFISLHGEMPIVTFHQRRITDTKIARLYKTEYKLTNQGLQESNKKYLGLGADPRIVSNGTVAYAYVIGYGEAKHPAFLYSSLDDSLLPLKAEKNFAWGKNWQPFIQDEKLFIVHSLSPFHIYEINLQTYTLEPIHLADTDFALAAHFTNYTMLRGGANAISEEDTIYGIGRASTQPYKHYPFLWSSYQKQAPIIQFIDFFQQLSHRGFSIIDPTSFFKQKNTLFMGLCCSETCWFFSQDFLNILLVFDPENQYKELTYLENILATYEPIYKKQKPRLQKHLFPCDRLQHAIAYHYEYGVQSVGSAGTLVYGPYADIEESMILMIELSYLTIEDGGDSAGSFDIFLSHRDEREEVTFIKYTECELQKTNKEIDTAVLFFDTKEYLGYQAEFRVFVQENVQLNAFHIRSKQIPEPIICTTLPTTFSVTNRNGIRSSSEKVGFLFFGPYRLIEEDGSFTATLRYKVDAPNHDQIATFDIAVSKKDHGVTVIAETEILPTDGQWSYVSVPFKLEKHIGFQLETRVYVQKKIDISASYICIQKN